MTRRVVVAGVIVVCLAALLAGGITYVRFSADLLRSTDTSLASLAAKPRLLINDRVVLSQLTGPSGGVLAQSPSLAQLGTVSVTGTGFGTEKVGGQSLRVYTRLLPNGRLLTVAQSLASNHADLARLRRGIATGMIIGAILASIVLVFVTRRALRPVRDTARVADRITTTNDLAARVPEPDGRDEVARLATSINRMLDHLEASDAALRRLVADASHELRTPVTSLRGNLEMLTDGTPLTGADRAAALEDARAETAHLQELVEGLLALARADAAPGAGEPVPFADLVRETAAGGGTGSPAVSAAAEPLVVHGDRVALRGVVRNLVENADRYGGGAEVSVNAEGARTVVLRVVDHGPGIPAAERETVFGRFTRGSTSAGQAGSGLGLAIVAATVRAHGGTVSLGETPGGGTTVTVTLPADR